MWPPGVWRAPYRRRSPAHDRDTVRYPAGQCPRAGSSTGRAVDLGVRSIFFFSRLHTADLIMGVVGDSDIAELPAGVGLEPGKYRPGHRQGHDGAALVLGLVTTRCSCREGG